MSEVGAFTMHLYCDHEQHPPKVHSSEVTEWEYSCWTRAQCVKEAKRDGWKFDKKRGVVICPECVKKVGSK